MKYRVSILQAQLMWAAAAGAFETGVITGKVVDNHTQETLFSVNVVVLGTQRGAATDAEGIYRVTDVPVGTYQVRFSSIGYEPQVKTDVVVKSAAPVFVNARLEPQAVEGTAVKVRAAYFRAQTEVAPSTVSLSREEIRRFPGGFEDVVRTVSTLPGVAVNMSGGRNDILVRGGGPSENLYLINNIEVPNINHFGTPGNTGGSLSFVNLDFVDDVAFSTGGFGARYGDKMSSVVDLTLSRRRPERFETKATVSATQFGLNVELPLRGKGGLFASARKSYLDLIFKAAGLPFVPVYTDYNVVLNYDFSPKDRLFLIGFSAIDNVDRNQSTLEDRVFNAGLLDNTQYKGITGLNYQRLFSKGYLDLTFNVNLSRYQLSQIDENERTYFKSDADEWETAAKLQVFRTLGPRLSILSGVSVKSVRNDNTSVFADTVVDRSGNRIPRTALGIPGVTSVDETAEKWAGFVEFEWNPRPVLSFTWGIRADRYDFIDKPFVVSPRVGAKLRLSENHTLRASGGLYTQAPSTVWVTEASNRGLLPLENRMAVLGWDVMLRRDTRLSLEAYAKRYRHLPAGVLPGATDYVVMSNTGSSFGGREDDFQSFGFFELAPLGTGESSGMEISIQKKFSDIPLYGLFSLASNRTDIKAPNGKTYPGLFDQRWIFNLSGGYVFNAKWEVSAKFRYFTGVPYTPVYRPSANPLHQGTVQNLPQEYLAARLGPGHQLDVRVDRTFNFSKATLIAYVDIQNVYNYKYPMKPQYDFWNDKVVTRGEIGILPSLGISLEI